MVMIRRPPLTAGLEHGHLWQSASIFLKYSYEVEMINEIKLRKVDGEERWCDEIEETGELRKKNP